MFFLLRVFKVRKYYFWQLTLTFSAFLLFFDIPGKIIAASEASSYTIAVCCGIPVSHDSNVLLNGRAMDDFSACSVAIS